MVKLKKPNSALLKQNQIPFCFLKIKIKINFTKSGPSTQPLDKDKMFSSSVSKQLGNSTFLWQVQHFYSFQSSLFSVAFAISFHATKIMHYAHVVKNNPICISSTEKVNGSIERTTSSRTNDQPKANKRPKVINITSYDIFGESDLVLCTILIYIKFFHLKLFLKSYFILKTKVTL